MKTYRILTLATGLLGISYFVYFTQKNTVVDNQTVVISTHQKNITSVLPLTNPQSDNKKNNASISERPATPKDVTEDKLALFNLKNNNIHHDEYGNNSVDISTSGFNSQEIIISDAQIYYPTEEQLNNGVSGCAMGGYYVELNSKLNLVIKTEKDTNVFSYVCAHNAGDNSYRLLQTTSNPTLEQSMAAVTNKAYN